jgi:hypothetical protein
VLDPVGESGPSGEFVSRADAVKNPGAHRSDVPEGAEEDLEPVGERMAFYGCHRTSTNQRIADAP